jgi:hypothetical protein
MRVPLLLSLLLAAAARSAAGPAAAATPDDVPECNGHGRPSPICVARGDAPEIFGKLCPAIRDPVDCQKAEKTCEPAATAGPGADGACDCDEFYSGLNCEYYKEPGTANGRLVGVHRPSKDRSGAAATEARALAAALDAPPSAAARTPRKKIVVEAVCMHGRAVCPRGRHPCGDELRCLCRAGWTGKRCERPLDGAARDGAAHDGAAAPLRGPEGPARGTGAGHRNPSLPAPLVRRAPTAPAGAAAGARGPASAPDPRNSEAPSRTAPGTASGTASAARPAAPSSSAPADPPTPRCDRTCAHGGTLNKETCRCEQCRGDCYGRGFWDKQKCICVCVGPWDPRDNCLSCPPIDCGEHGEFDVDSCSCKCADFWSGLTCRECPSLEELVVAGADCGPRGFELDGHGDEGACRCRERCPDDACVHGTVRESDCGCDCGGAGENPGRVGPARGERAKLAPRAALVPARAAPSLVELRSRVSAPGSPSRSPARSDASGLPPLSFWTGARCDQCRPGSDAPCPIGRAFDYDACECSSECDPFPCANGGVFSAELCLCQCPWTMAGPQCDEPRTGQSEALAAVSCRAVLAVSPGATRGVYWLQPDPLRPAFQARCDGGWIEVARVGKRLSEQMIDGTMYREGYKSLADGEYVLSCGRFNDTLLERTVEMRLTMGNVTDFFSPADGATLCGMLGSHEKHRWRPRAEVRPAASGLETALPSDGAPSDAGPTQQSARTGALFGAEPSGAFAEVGAAARAGLLARRSLRARRGAVGSAPPWPSRTLGAGAGPARRAARRLLAVPDPGPPERGGGAEDAAGRGEGRSGGSGEDAGAGGSDWIVPEYVSDPKLAGLLGGCKRDWPSHVHDARDYISFWGGDKGGCCHYNPPPYLDNGSWGKEFTLAIRELDVGDMQR